MFLSLSELFGHLLKPWFDPEVEQLRICLTIFSRQRCYPGSGKQCRDGNQGNGFHVSDIDRILAFPGHTRPESARPQSSRKLQSYLDFARSAAVAAL